MELSYNFPGATQLIGEKTMNNLSSLQGNIQFSGALDLSAGLGYGLIYQPIIGSSTSPDFPFAKKFFFHHRRKLLRRPSDMRRTKLAE